MDLSHEAIFILLGLLLLRLPFVLKLGEVDIMLLFGVYLLVAARNVWVMWEQYAERNMAVGREVRGEGLNGTVGI
jgi:hypothetical protein